MKRGLSNICYGFFSTLANPTRLAILEKLGESDMTVTQLAEAIGQEQSMISHNLDPLERCRFIYSEKKGKTRSYSLNRDTVEALFKTVEEHARSKCPHKGKCVASR